MRHRDLLPGDVIGHGFLELGHRDSFSSPWQHAAGPGCRRNVAVTMPCASEPTTALRERQSRFPTLIVEVPCLDVAAHAFPESTLSSRRLIRHEYRWAVQLQDTSWKTVVPFARRADPKSHCRLAP